ncbi:MAG: tetratricopeptide repeat protein [Symploca sp. SIO3C6]|nr:tetratricopeptide repeat protein [Symploca sp. SIO3C6]
MNTKNCLESDVKSLIETASQKHKLGNLHEAESIYRQILEIRSISEEEQDFISDICHFIINNLGNILQKQGKLEEAVKSYQQAIKLKSDFVEAHYNLGNALQQQRKLEKAAESYRQALKLNPSYAPAHNNLGNILKAQGKLEEAVQAYQHGLKLNPNYAHVHNNLGNILQEQGKSEEAVQSYQQALRLNPNFAEVHNNLGKLLKEEKKLEKAVQAYQQALKLKPNFVEAHYNLGNALKAQGKLEEAVQAYQQALKLKPNFNEAKFGRCMSQLPIIYSSTDEILLRRDNYQRHLQALVDSYKLEDQKELANAADAVGSLQPFYLAYQGLNDRDLQQTYGEMICRLMSSRYPQWSQPISIPDLAGNQKIRVGFISGFFYNHSVWKIPIKGWLENLDKNLFELFGYYTGSKQDNATARATQAVTKFIQGSLSVEKWCELIRQDNLDILIFPEFGMDPTTIKLGCLKLAPVQVLFGGHPETSGLPTIDYHLTSDLMEPENAQDHYTEKLVRLPNLAVHYTCLDIEPQTISKQEIGIAEHEVMFWCCQSLFKYLPQHDDIFPRIAKELINCKFVFIKHLIDASDKVTEVFQQRLNRAFDEFGLNYQDYCIFLPRLKAREFAGVTAIADIFLDNIGWSGNNTIMESTAHNLPIVTWPGELMRARHAVAILKMMGIEETIASSKDEYVKIAVRLGKDPQYRQHISSLVAQNKHKLYGDPDPIAALEDFILNTVTQKDLSVKNQPNQSLRRREKREFGMAKVSQVSETLKLAVKNHQANRLAEAVQGYQKVLAQQPNHPEALHGLGVLAQQNNQPQEAEKLLSKALKVQPESFKSWFSLGNLHQAQGQLPEAETAYQQAINLQPKSAPIYNNLGYTLQQQGKFEEAIACYQKALELEPNCVEADVNWGNALDAQGKLSTEKQVHYAQLNNKLGFARKQAGDMNNAVAYYRQAITLQPDLWEAHYNLGVALQTQGNLEEAIACYRRALELNPNYGEFYLGLGQIYQIQHKLEESAAAYKQGLKLINPRYAEAVEAYQSSTTPTEEHTPPQLQLREVTVGDYQFPVIPPVAESEEKRPFWTVIIPLYNRKDYLLECLASVLAQWRGKEEMEILVMDNASSPPLYDLVNAIAGGIVRYYLNPENIGARRNFNLGIALSRGKWIHLLPEDEYVLPGFYSRLQQSLEGCPDSVGAAFTGYENINENRQVIFTQKHALLHQGINQEWLQRIGVSNPLNPCATVIRRVAHERLGVYDPSNLYTPDWELYKRIAAFYDWWFEPGILARYRQHSQNMSSEVFLAGVQGEYYRKGIEISESYLPTEYRTQITAKARRHYFNLCLTQAQIPLKAGNLAAAFRLVQEAIKIDSSPEAVTKLFTWLTTDKVAPLRNAIADKMIAKPSDANNHLDNLYFAYP